GRRAAELGIGIGDQLRVHDRAQERIARADVGLRIAATHEHADADPRDHHLASLGELAERHQLVGGRAAHDGDVGDLALFELVDECKRRRIADFDLVAGGLLELRYELAQRAPDRAWGQKRDFRRGSMVWRRHHAHQQGCRRYRPEHVTPPLRCGARVESSEVQCYRPARLPYLSGTTFGWKG